MISKFCTLSALALLFMVAPPTNAGNQHSNVTSPPPPAPVKRVKASPAATSDCAGVTYYYSGVPDATITSTFVNSPKSYNLVNMNTAFAKGYPGVNFPQRVGNFNVQAFREIRFQYTCSPDSSVSIHDTPLVTLFVRTPADGFWHTSPGVGNGTSNGPGANLMYQFVSFQPAGWLPAISAARAVDQADLIFFGGTDKAATSIRIGDFVIAAQGGVGNTPSFTPSSYATTADTAFNHQFPVP